MDKTTKSKIAYAVAVLGVLLTLTSPLWLAWIRACERRSEIICKISQEAIGSAIEQYQREGDGSNPDMVILRAAPVRLDCSGSVLGKRKGYVYRGTDLTMGAPKEMVLLYCPEACHNGNRNVLFADFQVRALTEESLQKAVHRDNELRKQLGLPEKAYGN